MSTIQCIDLPEPPIAQVCISSDECSEDEYCALSEGACSGEEQAVCEPRPDVCNENYSPVCGCDGETYSNDCFASRAGISIKHSGVCSDCTTIEDCPGGYCSFEVGLCGGSGTCSGIPDCAEPVEGEEVCGCDGETYASACIAAGNAVSLEHEGACEEN